MGDERPRQITRATARGGDRASGSGVFARDPDAHVYLTAHEDDNCLSVSAILREFPPMREFVVRWANPLLTVDSTASPKALSRPGTVAAGPEDAAREAPPETAAAADMTTEEELAERVAVATGASGRPRTPCREGTGNKGPHNTPRTRGTNMGCMDSMECMDSSGHNVPPPAEKALCLRV